MFTAILLHILFFNVSLTCSLPTQFKEEVILLSVIKVDVMNSIEDKGSHALALTSDSKSHRKGHKGNHSKVFSICMCYVQLVQLGC
jgi:hypothetical protein